ncbi:MAG: 3',5'-cyclic-nucleotide phosphodiesterase [Phycisphaerales bacterium]|nr:metallophosphoesterase [Phycisphaerae bacterium]NNF41462.1 3',5'-cyclic-nucleotide phosphodiesterase [Phycisphaerales bacterium]NNM25018.1 3',5'-cyclic-nucleotide phosphodiesterase [Phycisphaerales bacterium]
MLSILHISDLHFGPPYLARIGEALQAIAPTLGPDVVIASGDFTQRAKREQFEQARRFVDALPGVPKVFVPGNHDVPLYRIAERFTRPLELYREHMSNELDGVLRLDEAVIVWLNSTSPRRAISNGRIHLDQLAFCEETLRSVPSSVVKIVVTHHHFLPAPDFERDQTMPKARRALDVFVRLGVDMILGGHLHRAYIGNSLDVYAGADREHGIIIVQCGTTTSRRGRGREREKNSFNLLRIDGDVLKITHYLYFDDERRFEPVSHHAFPRPGRRPFQDGLLAD